MERMNDTLLHVSITLSLKNFLTSFYGADKNFVTRFANIFTNSWHRYLYAYSKLKLLLSFEVAKDKLWFELFSNTF